MFGRDIKCGNLQYLHVIVLKQQFRSRKGILPPDNVHIKIIYIYDIYW